MKGEKVHGPTEMKRGAFAAVGGALVAGLGLLLLASFEHGKKPTAAPAVTPGQPTGCADCTGQRNPAKVYG